MNSAKKIFRKGITLVTVIALMITMVSEVAFAAEYNVKDTSAEIFQNVSNSLTFSNLDNAKMHEVIEKEVLDKDGNIAKVGIELVDTPEKIKNLLEYENGSKIQSRTWKVYYTGLTINASFYMVVSNNKVVSVYDSWILVIGGTYDNDKLTKTSTYGKLSFKMIGLNGIFAGTCWLKGTVTGSDDEIDVSWQM